MSHHHLPGVPGTGVRGYMVGDRGARASAGSPVWALNQDIGRCKVIHNSFTVASDVAAAINTAAPAAGAVNLVRSPIPGPGDSAGSSLVISSTAGPYTTVPFARFTGSTAAPTGTQWVQAATLNEGGTVGLAAGVGASLAGAGARDYSPELLLTFVAETGAGDAAVQNGSFAVGLLNATVPVLSNSADGAIATGGAQSGFFFRMGAGIAGPPVASGLIECVWVAGGVIQARTITNERIITGGASATIRFGLRVRVTGLTGVAAPLMAGSTSVEYWVNDKLLEVFTRASSATDVFPLNIGPGVALVRTTASSHAVNMGFWTYTIGPMRSGATTI